MTSIDTGLEWDASLHLWHVWHGANERWFANLATAEAWLRERTHDSH